MWMEKEREAQSIVLLKILRSCIKAEIQPRKTTATSIGHSNSSNNLRWQARLRQGSEMPQPSWLNLLRTQTCLKIGPANSPTRKTVQVRKPLLSSSSASKSSQLTTMGVSVEVSSLVAAVRAPMLWRQGKRIRPQWIPPWMLTKVEKRTLNWWETTLALWHCRSSSSRGRRPITKRCSSPWCIA